MLRRRLEAAASSCQCHLPALRYAALRRNASLIKARCGGGLPQAPRRSSCTRTDNSSHWPGKCQQLGFLTRAGRRQRPARAVPPRCSSSRRAPQGRPSPLAPEAKKCRWQARARGLRGGARGLMTERNMGRIICWRWKRQGGRCGGGGAQSRTRARKRIGWKRLLQLKPCIIEGVGREGRGLSKRGEKDDCLTHTNIGRTKRAVAAAAAAAAAAGSRAKQRRRGIEKDDSLGRRLRGRCINRRAAHTAITAAPPAPPRRPRRCCCWCRCRWRSPHCRRHGRRGRAARA